MFSTLIHHFSSRDVVLATGALSEIAAFVEALVARPVKIIAKR
jgi:hypothetical protein